MDRILNWSQPHRQTQKHQQILLSLNQETQAAPCASGFGVENEVRNRIRVDLLAPSGVEPGDTPPRGMEEPRRASHTIIPLSQREVGEQQDSANPNTRKNHLHSTFLRTSFFLFLHNNFDCGIHISPLVLFETSLTYFAS